MWVLLIFALIVSFMMGFAAAEYRYNDRFREGRRRRRLH
jgi:hypothetical protein